MAGVGSLPPYAGGDNGYDLCLAACFHDYNYNKVKTGGSILPGQKETIC